MNKLYKKRFHAVSITNTQIFVRCSIPYCLCNKKYHIYKSLNNYNSNYVLSIKNRCKINYNEFIFITIDNKTIRNINKKIYNTKDDIEITF